MHGTACQPGNQVAVDGSDCNGAAQNLTPNGWFIARYPGEFCRRKIWVKTKAGEHSNWSLCAESTKLFNNRRAATVLPDDCLASSDQVVAPPQNHSFTLVGDSDGNNASLAPVVANRRACFAKLSQGAANRNQRCLPDLLRVVLDPSWLLKMLLELL